MDVLVARMRVNGLKGLLPVPVMDVAAFWIKRIGFKSSRVVVGKELFRVW